jgi:hypothetical protein
VALRSHGGGSPNLSSAHAMGLYFQCDLGLQERHSMRNSPRVTLHSGSNQTIVCDSGSSLLSLDVVKR